MTTGQLAGLVARSRRTPPRWHLPETTIRASSAPKTVAAEGRDGGEVTRDEVVPDTCPSESSDDARAEGRLSFICSVGRASPGTSHSTQIPVRGWPGLSGGGGGEM